MDTPAVKTALNGFGHYLVTTGLLEKITAQEALEKASASRVAYIEYLTQQNIINNAHLARTISSYFGIPLLDLDAFDTSLIPMEIMNTPVVQKRQALPLLKKDGYILIAVVDPMLPALNDIKFLTGLNIHLVIVEADKLQHRIDEILSAQLLSGLGDLNDSKLDDVNVSVYEDGSTLSDTTKADAELAEDNTVVRYVNKVLLDAINCNASDIHFEPYDGYYRIRYRQDGLLQKIASPPIKIASYIVARIKVMANLDISEHRIPQDGRFKLNLSKHRAIDFRVSTCPTLFGEKVVMRILNTTQSVENIDALGMDELQKEYFLQSLKRSQGMILVSGPTGSGKTVTLYTALNILNTLEKNISTVEDPVEIPVQGINQVHVNLKTGLTFSTALRSFLRQDPDIIMVGEIRDLETAEIAVKAAQTGHLVLSTLHTNGASATIQRLANMGVAPFNLASSVALIIAQRLVRKLCKQCKQLIELPSSTLLKEGFTESELINLKLYGPGSCKACNNGYKGRMGIFEVLPITSEISQIIIKGGDVSAIEAEIQQIGLTNLRRSGLDKVKQGLTSLDELNRVFIG